MAASVSCVSFFFFNNTATTGIYTLSLHDALPICRISPLKIPLGLSAIWAARLSGKTLWLLATARTIRRSEEHTSELQSRPHLVCRLLLEKKKLPRHSRSQTSLPHTHPHDQPISYS